MALLNALTLTQYQTETHNRQHYLVVAKWLIRFQNKSSTLLTPPFSQQS